MWHSNYKGETNYLPSLPRWILCIRTITHKLLILLLSKLFVAILIIKIFIKIRFSLSHYLPGTSILFCMLLFFSSSILAQEKSGVTLSNFGGINSARLNPSSLINSKIYYDISLFSADFFVENNFIFIHKEDFSLGKYLTKNPDLPSTDIPGQGLDYNSATKFIRAFEQTDIYGPAFSIALEDHAVGFFTRAVTMASVSNMPGYLGILLFEGLQYDTIYGIDQNYDEFQATTAGWWELGLSYAYKFRKHKQNEWSLGINVRRLFGYAGMHLSNYNADYTVVDQNTIDIRNLDAEISYSIPIDYDNNDFPAPGKTFKGRGTAFDLGFTYRRNRELPSSRNYKNFCQYEFTDYVYKIGVSLLDLGNIKFSENDAVQRYDNVSAFWTELDTIQFQSINDMAGQLSTVFYGDPNTATANSDNISIGMPAALSLQVDYNYFSNWYVSSMLLLPLQIGKNQISRPGQALVSLRYETAKFEVALPVSLYDFSKPRIGLSARFYYVTIGTDKLGGFFGFDDFYGMDFYLSLKFHILKGWCGRYKPASDCSNYNF